MSGAMTCPMMLDIWTNLPSASTASTVTVTERPRTSVNSSQSVLCPGRAAQRTVCSQNRRYPPHASHCPAHRLSALLVKATVRPMPACPVASTGLPSSSVSSSWFAPPLGPVSTSPSNCGRADPIPRTISPRLETIRGVKGSSMIRARRTTRASLMKICGSLLGFLTL